MSDEVMSFTVACKMFFGFKPEQGLSDFAAEVRKLTPKDRDDMRPGLEKALNVRIKD